MTRRGRGRGGVAGGGGAWLYAEPETSARAASKPRVLPDVAAGAETRRFAGLIFGGGGGGGVGGGDYGVGGGHRGRGGGAIEFRQAVTSGA